MEGVTKIYEQKEVLTPMVKMYCWVIVALRFRMRIRKVTSVGMPLASEPHERPIIIHRRQSGKGLPPSGEVRLRGSRRSPERGQTWPVRSHARPLARSGYTSTLW